MPGVLLLAVPLFPFSFIALRPIRTFVSRAKQGAATRNRRMMHPMSVSRYRTGHVRSDEKNLEMIERCAESPPPPLPSLYSTCSAAPC